MSVRFVRNNRVRSGSIHCVFRGHKYEICGKSPQQIILPTAPEQDFFYVLSGVSTCVYRYLWDCQFSG